jgi:glycosyltransferase involved in cell wall biosynthesis
MLKRAIACFESQTYSNCELLVLVESDDDDTIAYMHKKEGDKIRKLVVTNDNMKLGDLRNIAVEYAAGGYICQWDDDDWYHRDRVKHQLAAAITNGKAGSILTRWIMYDVEHGNAYLSGERLWEGSILVSKNELKKHRISYPSLARGEDNKFITNLVSKSSIQQIAWPSLYIYTFHGRNTWDRGHFQYNFNVGKKLPPALSDAIGSILTSDLSDHEAADVLKSPELQHVSLIL